MTIFGTKESNGTTALENALELFLCHAELIAVTGAPVEIVEAADEALADHDHGGVESWDF